MQKMPKKYFSNYRKPLIELPLLSEVQLNSYDWFFKRGLRELFNEISPLHDYTNKELSLEFLDYYLDEPKYTENEAKEHNLSFEAALRMRAKLTNKRTGEIKEQEIYLGDFPLMTPRGTFIVNGVERVVVSQLIRSSGVYFTMNAVRGKRLYGAKIIPNRGAWLELETESDGTIVAKIDRRRKIPISSLLRIFGLTDDAAITELFSSVNNGEVNYIAKTLERDSAKTADEAYIEVYKRIRPGDLATVDNARNLINSLFSFERYDLAEVGRYKFNQRLGLGRDPKKDESRTLNLEDLVAVVKEIIKMNNYADAPADDIDALGNRRVRGVGELLQQKLRIGIARMARIVRDRMSTLDIYTLTPAQLINARPFMASLKEFFTSSQLSQFMDQINPLSELEHERRLSALGPGGLARERAGFEVRDVHQTHYGRICPIQTPEGPNIGLVGHLASYARINDLGLIETPYAKINNGRPTGEVVYMNASAEAQYVIAHASTPVDENGYIKESRVETRIAGQATMVERERVDFIDVSSQQAISIATSLIPFLEHDDANRAMMGSNMQRQAVPLISSELPVVSTGMEERAARDSGRVLVAEEDGEIIEADAAHVVFKSAESGKSKTYRMNTFMRTNQSTSVRQKVRAIKGERVKKGDVLADSSSTDHGELALGRNLVVAFVSWAGFNYEDAIIINERLVREDLFTSIHIEDYTIDVRDTKLGPETTTADITNVSEAALRNLDESGVVRIGAEVRSGDILVGKITPKGEADLTPEERLLRAIFGEKAKDVKDTSLRLPHGKRGRVVGVREFSREHGDKLESGVIKKIQIEVAQLRKVSVGDKLAGRHGNKGVIARVLPEEDMPYLADGTPVDVILNPLGVVSRMNIGQILETHLGWAGKILKYQAITPALAGATEDEIKAELEKAGLPKDGQVFLQDGRNGESFTQKVTVGVIYILKLNHLVEDKIHMRSIGPYSLITQQPLGGKAQFGGQRFGEMEVWALEGYGSAYTLQEMLTIKSDDVQGRSATYEAIINGEKIQAPNLPASFHVLVNELKGLGLDVELIDKKEEIVPSADEVAIYSKEVGQKEQVTTK
ncbi:MAG: DNA-directed RNA polymerase subunit beta [Candidatus Sungbacteria bacterium RIFCSPLOWO2_02_FULL_48_13b]|uniref:DNA-directed RNA polymerase subunit beta n=2 Tax=Candidatus Sungiibacteriota TaxID=1817917 RepID=A0A1G2LEX2_9BACT|nr:MAG: DNA-directed RNA polymerase subunit beta [Candidatus Sungbacteria bacterium RIFCSPHIGHO2_02_FULL_49_20]OHA10185.1 MAG: DNA-directed RNA polymerase subunit beta [Candidatus Sungbacteria bacterium RIFCSPLOWO2_02_FULL_48_13b]